MTQLVKENISQVQHRYQQFADSKRTERSFEVGDMLYLQLQPC